MAHGVAFDSVGLPKLAANRNVWQAMERIEFVAYTCFHGPVHFS